MTDELPQRHSDARAPRFPVSVKAVLVLENRVVLLKNERDEWELPGGKLEPGEQPAETLLREISEELSIDVADPQILDSWLYPLGDGAHRIEVLIITYTVSSEAACALCKLSQEHKELGFFVLSDLSRLKMPANYLESILHARALGRVRL